MRPGWDEYFLQLAELVSSRSTCDRKHCGAVIVKDNKILATGYNGSIKGLPHCNEIGHLIVNNSCVRTIHSEQNAIAQAARYGTAIEGATIYINAIPCWICFRIISNSGIKRIVAYDAYKYDEKVMEAARASNIELTLVTLSGDNEEPDEQEFNNVSNKSILSPEQ